MKVNIPTLPRTSDLHQEALQILIKNKGIAKAAILMSDTFWKPIDYLEIKDRLFEDETVDSIYEKVIAWRNNWSDY
jgi:hypothetical protein